MFQLRKFPAALTFISILMMFFPASAIEEGFLTLERLEFISYILEEYDISDHISCDIRAKKESTIREFSSGPTETHSIRIKFETQVWQSQMDINMTFMLGDLWESEVIPSTTGGVTERITLTNMKDDFMWLSIEHDGEGKIHAIESGSLARDNFCYPSDKEINNDLKD